MIREELIGKTITVTHADNESLIGISGQVVDETKNTLRIRSDRGEKTLIKEQVTLRIQDVEVKGKLLTQRPEKRTKLTVKKWQRKKPHK